VFEDTNGIFRTTDSKDRQYNDQKKKQYEAKRERNFQENWADEFPGVRHAVQFDEGNIDESTPKVMFICYISY
jgi:hypothetical protein